MQFSMSFFIGLLLSVSVSAEPLLEGRVRLSSGQPVANAQVRLFDLTNLHQSVGTTTDETGHFALSLPAAAPGSALPQGFALGQNYPNPFNPSTIIPYQIPAAAHVRLEVFNLLGQRLATLVDAEKAAGAHTATWTATDETGRAVGAGVYIYRLVSGSATVSRRMVLIDGQAGTPAAGAASVLPGVSGDGAGEQTYGLVVAGPSIAPYVVRDFRVEAGMAPVEVVVEAHPAGKALGDDLSDLFDLFNTQQEEASGPDLIVQSPSVSDSTLTPGQAFTLSATVQNQGDQPAAATTVRYYRSNNATITASDTQIGTNAVGELTASATQADSLALTAPTPAFTYFYGACVDPVADESNTDNNCSRAVRVTVEASATEETPEPEPEEEDSDALVNIPDPNLRRAIEATLGKGRGAPITVAEMASLRGREFDGEPLLQIVHAGISDLTGLEYATNLRGLWLGGNDITDIAALAGLTNLQDLSLGINDITDIAALARLTNLQTLDLWLNDITDIAVLARLTNLKYLNLSDNDITDIAALARLTNLQTLNLGGNDITDIAALARLTNLQTLSLWGNDITDIAALARLTNLQTLGLGDNDITDIAALAQLTNLRELYLEFNSIQDISALVGLPHLATLEIQGNPLSNSSINNHIPTLESRGVRVKYDSYRVHDFDIEIVYLSSFTERQKEHIQYGAKRWMAVITEDLPDYTFAQHWSGQCGDQFYEIPAGERIDDLRIYVSQQKEEELGRVAGYGSPQLLREKTHLPVLGCMVFSSGVPVLHSLPIHEIGHVLGFGTIWDDFGLLQDQDADIHFNGPRAIADFDASGGRGYTGKKVPVDQDRAHWRHTVLGFQVNDGLSIPTITVQSLADLGYSVDISQADAYTVFDASAKASAKISAAMPSILGVNVPHAEHALSCGVGLIDP